MTRSIIVFAILTGVSIFISGCRRAAEPARPLEVKPLEVELPEVELPSAKPRPAVLLYEKCAELLTNFVDENGMVDYKRLRWEKPKLRALQSEFDKLDPNEYNRWPKEGKIAFWINTYNIQLLKIILDNYPIKSTRIHRLFWPPASIRHIKGIWSRYKFIVMDEEFTLAEIERRFFREEFGEPRVFFAISGASLSAPPLRSEPYCADKLGHQLDEQAERFLASPLAFRIDRKNKVVYLSAILQPTWYGKYFVQSYGTDKKFKDKEPAVRAVLNFITNYVSERDAHFLEIENYSVEYIRYDWSLNE